MFYSYFKNVDIEMETNIPKIEYAGNYQNTEKIEGFNFSEPLTNKDNTIFIKIKEN